MADSTSLIQVTDASFAEEVLLCDLPVLVDFWAPWCGPCRALGVVLEDLAVANASRLKIVKLNTDENPEIATRYDIVSLPTLLMFRGGAVIRQLRGPTPKAMLEREISEALG